MEPHLFLLAVKAKNLFTATVQEVQATRFGDGGSLNTARPNSVFILCATISWKSGASVWLSVAMVAK